MTPRLIRWKRLQVSSRCRWRLANFFQKLAAVAPDSIEPDVQDLQNTFQQEANNLGNDMTDPLGGLASGIAESLEYAPAWNAVNNWTESNSKSYSADLME